MKKESALYRFVYVLALLAAVAAVYGTGLFGLYQGLADLALASTANPPPAVITAVYAALFAALAAVSLVFTALFNMKPLAGRARQKCLMRSATKPWPGWVAIAAAVCALFLVLRYSLPGADFLDDSPARMGLVFFFMPFLWEYALGLNAPRTLAPAATSVKAAPTGAKPAEIH